MRGVAQQSVLRAGGNSSLGYLVLGQPPSVPDANIPIRNIDPPLNIDTGPFSLEELQLAKKQIVEGKARGDGSFYLIIWRGLISMI